MNNNQNNQGMNNQNPSNGIISNNSGQPINQETNNNINNQNNQGMNNQNPSNGMLYNNNGQPMNINTPNFTTNNSGKQNNKKTLLFVVVAIIVLIVLIGLFSNSSKDSTFSESGTGTESNDINNQTIYKIIDYNSYSGDSESTQFDSLVDKKVTFTNVPAWSGYLGSLSKSINCSNESSLTIEDDVEYTVTGILTSASGTVFVNLKDCTITKE